MRQAAIASEGIAVSGEAAQQHLDVLCDALYADKYAQVYQSEPQLLQHICISCFLGCIYLVFAPLLLDPDTPKNKSTTCLGKWDLEAG